MSVANLRRIRWAGLLLASIVVAGIGQHASARQEPEPPARIQKIKIQHVNAVVLASELGGGIYNPNMVDLPESWGQNSAVGGGLAQLLPNDVDAIVGSPVDNTILIKGTDQAIRDARALIAQVDLPPRPISCRAEIVFSLRDLSGQRHVTRLEGSARTSEGRPFRLKTRSDSGQSAGGPPGAPASESYDLTLDTRMNPDGHTIHLHGDWIVEIRWSRYGAGPPVGVHHEMHVEGASLDGLTTTLGKASLQLPSGGIAELTLKVTPRTAPQSGRSQP